MARSFVVHHYETVAVKESLVLVHRPIFFSPTLMQLHRLCREYLLKVPIKQAR